MTDHSSFEGKVVIITGSTDGLGAATARLMAKRGAKGIVVCGRNAERGKAVVAELEAIGSAGHFVQGDLANVDDCRKIVAETVETFGTVHVLVNVVGLSKTGSIWDTSPDLWDEMMGVNLRAPFLLMQDTLKVMFRDKIEGTIVNVSSVVSHGGPPFLTAYSTTKGSLNTLTRNVAYAVMRHRVRVNGINFGWMDTPTQRAALREGWIDKVEVRQPFGRIIKVDEAARAIAYLASDESGMLTGTITEYDQSVIGGGEASKPRKGVWGTEGIAYE